MKTPKARKLSSGTWFIQLRLGGESVPVTAATERECRRKAQLIKAEYMDGRRELKQERTLRSVVDEYIDKRREKRSPATIRGYVKIRDSHFLQEMPLPVNRIDWQAAVDREQSRYAPKTVQNAFSFMCSSLKAAGFNRPAVVLSVAQTLPRAWLDDEQIPVFLDAIKGDSCEIAALLALHSLRVSEILGLTWDNIDLKAGIITVDGAVVLDEHDKPVAKDDNKNLTSKRYVRIMIPRLKSLLLKADKSKPVVPQRGPTIYTHVTRACVSAGLPIVTPHGLRHTFASLAVHVGLSERECQEIGGWKDPVTMHKIYQHISAKDRAKSENKISEFYKNAN